MSYQITLPAGLDLIETWEIPYLLTQAAYPDVPRAGVSCAEILGKSQAGEAAILEFPDSDRALLDRIWQGREDWRAGIPLHVFADYLAAFNDSPERPVWSLRWIASGGKHLEHRVELDAVVRRDIANGTLPVRREGTLVVIQPEDCMQDVHRHSVVSAEDFILYAKGLRVDVLQGDPVTPLPGERVQGIPQVDTSNKLRDLPRPWPRQRCWEEEVLRLIRGEGHDPTCLPDREPGKSGIKAVVRAKFSGSEKVFKKTWEGLRASGEILGGK